MNNLSNLNYKLTKSHFIPPGRITISRPLVYYIYIRALFMYILDIFYSQHLKVVYETKYLK